MSHEKDDDPKAQQGGWKNQVHGFGKFIWNSETHEFLGRTGKSWAQILIYYIIFYGCLAAFFAINISLFFTTIDDKAPRLQGFDTLLKGHPGMGFRPTPDNTLIAFEVSKSETYQADIQGLNDFLAPYHNQTDSNIYVDCADGKPVPSGKVCRFDVSTLGDCTQANNYGYPDGKPCVLLKLNKIYGWTPQNVTKSSLITEYYNATGTTDLPNNGNIPITCQGEVGADIDNLGTVNIFPSNGLPFNFYPYLNQDGYMAPIVMAQFTNPKRGALLMVWCKAWADNIYHDRTDLAGSVHFELMVDN